MLYIIRAENHHADALAKLATSKDAKLLWVILIRDIAELSIYARKEVTEVETVQVWNIFNEDSTWKHLVIFEGAQLISLSAYSTSCICVTAP